MGQDRDQDDGSRPKHLHAGRAGRQHHGRGRRRRDHHGGQPVRAAVRQDQGGHPSDLAAAGQIPGQHAFPRRSHRRQRELRQGRRGHRCARQYPGAPRGRHHRRPDRRAGAAAARGSAASANLSRRIAGSGGWRPHGAAHPCRQRPHRRRHLGLFRRRQCARHRRHHEQLQALPEHRLRQRRRRARHDPRAPRATSRPPTTTPRSSSAMARWRARPTLPSSATCW